MPVNVKNLIAETFVKLSDEKNIDKITVKDIVEACGISRQAFYYHFQDLLEVIDWSMEQAFEQLLDRSLQEDDPEIVLNDFITASCWDFWWNCGTGMRSVPTEKAVMAGMMLC